MSTKDSYRSARERMGAHTLRVITDEEGMSTAEYAIGTIAAAAFGAILYTGVPPDGGHRDSGIDGSAGRMFTCRGSVGRLRPSTRSMLRIE